MEYLFKSQTIKTFTRQVKNFLEGAQLQVFRAWKSKGGSWLYELKFFPGPKKGYLLGWDPEERDWALGALESPEDVAHAKSLLEAAQDPVQLFVRAHAINRRVESARFREGSLEVGGSSWELQLAGGCRLIFDRDTPQGQRIHIRVERDGEKDFRRSLDLGVLPSARGEQGLAAPSLRDASSELPAPSVKSLRLLQKVQGDIDMSRKGLGELQTLCSFLDADPMAWGRDSEWPADSTAALEWVRTQTRLPMFQNATRAQALESIYDLRRRYQRKLQGSQKRLLEVSAQLEAAAGESSAPQAPKAPVAATRAAVVSKTLGQWVEHPSGLKARLGKSARENAQLFREAGSRDLWFHIRGLGGSHIWVPRGQPLFGAKDVGLRDDLELWACQLAVFNSKARHSNYGVVDITEKRHLKAAKGQEGTLLIQRSETRIAELDDSFRKWLIR